MYCIGLKEAKPSADPIPPAPKEADAKADQKVTQVQVSPVELLVKPGEAVKLKVKLFNAKGQLVTADAKAKFTVEGVGSVSDSGEYTAPTDAAHVFAKIAADVDGVKSPISRVRVVPALPWSFDISDKQVPVTWIGAGIATKFATWMATRHS